jgi:BMFP domain-containing protein YqiC
VLNAAKARPGGLQEVKAMDKSQLEQTIQRLMEGLPASLQAMRTDLEAHFQRVLQSGARRLDLVSREEFDAQTKVLERSRALIEQLEARVKALEEKQGTSGI